MIRQPPNYCPGCGSPFQGVLDEQTGKSVTVTGAVDRMPFGGEEPGYDCFCPSCDWTGDILPDR